MIADGECKIFDISLKNVTLKLIKEKSATLPSKINDRGTHFIELKNTTNVSLDNVNVLISPRTKKDWDGAIKQQNANNFTTNHCNF